MFGIFKWVQSIVRRGLEAASTAISRATKPIVHCPVLGSLTDLARSKPQLVAENLLLRQQLVVLNRSVKRPHFTHADRGLFVFLASKLQSWKEALLIVQPETILRSKDQLRYEQSHAQRYKVYAEVRAQHREGYKIL